MNNTIRNQITAQIFLFIILCGFILGAVVTKETFWIIASIIFGIIFVLFGLQAIKIIKKEKGLRVKYDINYPLIIGIIFISSMFVICSYVLIKNISFRKNGIETIATVYDIDKKVKYKTEYDDDGHYYEKKDETCIVYINYFVGDKEYNNKLDSGSCKNKIGDKVTIYYNKNNPNDFVSNSIILLLFATIFSGGILIFIIYKCFKERLRCKKHAK